MSKDYFVFNQESNTSILGLEPLILAITGEGVKKIGGANLSILPFEFDQGKFRAITNIKECDAVSRIFLSKIENSREFEKFLVGHIREKSEEIKILCNKILSDLRARKIGEAERIKLIKKIYYKFIEMCSSGLIPPIIEAGAGGLTHELNQIFQKKAKEPGQSNQFAALLTYRFNEGYDFAIQKDLASIAQDIYENAKLAALFLGKNAEIIALMPKEIGQQIDQFINDWGWAYFGYSGPVYDLNRAIDEIKGLLALDIEPLMQIEKMRLEIAGKNDQQQKMIGEANFSEQELYLIRTAQDFSETKNIRAKMMCLASFTINELLKYFAIKENLSLKQFGALTISELYRYFSGDHLPPAKDLNQRYKYSLLITKSDGSEEMICGDRARKWVKDNVVVEEIDENSSQISGYVACQGDKNIVSGRVKIINIAADMAKFQEGDVLISINTIPEIVPAMKKAAAVITDVGGLTCHAAIISREINKLCVIGTKIATKVFKDGDLVEVDATKGMVKKI